MATDNRRILSIDILRGITVAGMILVNNGYGESFTQLSHSKWNGMTLCDLVFPFFLFIVGISTYLSLSKTDFKASPSVLLKIFRRAFLLFLIGLAINWFDLAVEGNFFCFDHLRYWAVLQRIAICYLAVALFAVTVNHRFTIPVIILLLVGYSLLLVFGNGYAEDGTNILARVDKALFGMAHLYHKSPVDPEGLLGTIPAIAHTLVGFYVGGMIKKFSSLEKYGKLLAVGKMETMGILLLLTGHFLSYFLPFNKRIWSPSYVLESCGLAMMLLSLLVYVIDIRGHRRWCGFFQVFGVNPLFLYVLSELLAIILGHCGVSEAVFTAIHSSVLYPQTASLLYALSFVLLNFLFGWILYARKIYIRL